MWKPLTKQTIFGEKEIHRKVLLDNLDVNPYVINISHRNKKLYISYRSEKFSLDDLQNIKLPEDYGGGMGRVILGNCSYLKYIYKNGFNIYVVDFSGQIALSDSFNFKIKV